MMIEAIKFYVSRFLYVFYNPVITWIIKLKSLEDLGRLFYNYNYNKMKFLKYFININSKIWIKQLNDTDIKKITKKIMIP